MQRRDCSWFVGILFAGVAFAPQPAGAHAFLEHAEPRVGSTVQGTPTAVTLTFTEPVEADFSRVDVTGAHGQHLDTGPLEHPTPTQLRLRLPPLPPGDYSVHWAVTSVDTHQTEGTFDFTVAAP